MLIIITLPTFHDGEAAEIVRLLQGGADLIHIRKPNATEEETEQLIKHIPEQWRSRLVLHDHHHLALRYHLHGVHLNSRHPEPPEGWTGSVSRSCHTLEEVEAWKAQCDYVSLSPIFDSISKPDYHAAFTTEDLNLARQDGIIDNKVMALGGITFSRVDDVLRMGFGGAMILGDAWHTLTDRPLLPTALTIAGSDPSAGAGVQQDLKTMQSLGTYAATVITALTAQNTLGVQHVVTVGAEMVAAQLDSVLADLDIGAVKIGMIPDAAVAHVIADRLRQYKAMRPHCAVVYDPVMMSTSGRELMQPDCLGVVERELFPLCTLVTPNHPEAVVLINRIHNTPIKSTLSTDYSILATRYGCAFLVKGGHNEGDTLTDSLFSPDGIRTDYVTPRIATTHLHGTGCALSSAITALLLRGLPLHEAIAQAQHLVADAIKRGKTINVGHGNSPIVVDAPKH